MSTPSYFTAMLLTAVIAYLLGSINFAVLISRKVAKDDVRAHGSGNAGMTNMLRTYGKAPAIATATGDFLKGLAAVAIGRFLFHQFGIFEFPFDPGYLAGFFVLLGHLKPIFFGFRGGKGVMTTLGVIAMVNFPVLPIVLVICVTAILITHIVSVGSLIGAVVYPFINWAVLYFQGRPMLYETLCSALISGIVIFVHRTNIKRLLSGTENRFGSKPKK